MKKIIFLLFALNISMLAIAQSDTTKPNFKFEKERIVYGGGIGGGIYTGITSISFSPILGYRVTDEFILGTRVVYNYFSFPNFGSGSNFGYGFLGRYFIKQTMFLHAEYQDIYYAWGGNQRQKVPALLGGVGYYNKPFTVTAMYDFIWKSRTSPFPSPLRINFGLMF